ncbi:MAG: hypothetical protein E2O54_08310 [Gammaproteobacteria bacterium]|nr:MAG: hypothetical protein E2O58_00730 [Gammaproteobacteria bacterium]TDJ40173.1 MAG: hypothetical protein E2O54_08310 [Gammaproteobacteria bacterium]
MSNRIWIVIAVIYAAFFYWYTSFGGPLSDEEIEDSLTVLREAGMEPERLEVWEQFMRSDTGDDFAMLNALDLRDEPLQVEGVEPGDTAEDVMARYSEPFLGRALLSAAHPVMFGTAAAPAMDLWGIEGAHDWTAGALVRYRSRRDLMQQAVYASSLDIHRFKTASLEKTIAYPLDPWYQLGDPRLVLGMLLLILGLALQLRRTARGAG